MKRGIVWINRTVLGPAFNFSEIDGKFHKQNKYHFSFSLKGEYE